MVICYYTTKFIWNLSRFSQMQKTAILLPNFYKAWIGLCKYRHLPIYHQICTKYKQIFAKVPTCQLVPKFIWKLGRFFWPRPSAILPSNLYKIQAGFCNCNYLPLFHQICIRLRQIVVSVSICHCATKFIWCLRRSF